MVRLDLVFHFLRTTDQKDEHSANTLYSGTRAFV